MNTEKVICIDSEGYEISLIMEKTYLTIPDQDAEQHGLIRVVDETGEDYLYPASCFVVLEAEQAGQGQPHAAD